jgi:hypothetical protein
VSVASIGHNRASAISENEPSSEPEWIIDAQKSRGGAATFADVVAGSGTSHYKMRFNGAMVI